MAKIKARSRTFVRESAAARWLAEQGYHYGGHFHDEGPSREDYDDADEPDRLAQHLQVTVWENGTPTFGDGRALLQSNLAGNRWTAVLLAAED